MKFKANAMDKCIFPLCKSLHNGKSHISISIGVEACKQGKTTLFFTAASLGNKLVEMQDTLQLSKFIDRLRNVDLLFIDELGYIELSHSTTQLMFQIFQKDMKKGLLLLVPISSLENGQKYFKMKG